VNSVANPRNEANPQTSVNVVMNTAEASAGSIFSALRPSGMSVPTRPATNRFMTMANARIMPSRKSPFITHATRAAMAPTTTPLPTPTSTFLSSAFPGVAPGQLPQGDATDDDRQRLCGRVATHAGHDRHEHRERHPGGESSAETLPTTAAARKAVARLTMSHGMRLRSDSLAGVKTRSSLDTPARRYRSSVGLVLDDVDHVVNRDDARELCCVRQRPESPAGCRTRPGRATSSWSMSTRALMGSAVMMRLSGVSGETSNNRRKRRHPDEMPARVDDVEIKHHLDVRELCRAVIASPTVMSSASAKTCGFMMRPAVRSGNSSRFLDLARLLAAHELEHGR
jgi:hypothetical protein